MPRQQRPRPPYKIALPAEFWHWLRVAEGLRLDVQHTAGRRDGSLDRPPGPSWWPPANRRPLVEWVDVPAWSDWYTFGPDRSASRPCVRVQVWPGRLLAEYRARRVGLDEPATLLDAGEVVGWLKILARDVPPPRPKPAPVARADVPVPPRLRGWLDLAGELGLAVEHCQGLPDRFGLACDWYSIGATVAGAGPGRVVVDVYDDGRLEPGFERRDWRTASRRSLLQRAVPDWLAFLADGAPTGQLPAELVAGIDRRDETYPDRRANQAAWTRRDRARRAEDRERTEAGLPAVERLSMRMDRRHG